MPTLAQSIPSLLPTVLLVSAHLAASPVGCLLSLELWGGQQLQCCCFALLLPCAWAPALAELQRWAAALPGQAQRQDTVKAATEVSTSTHYLLPQQDAKELLTCALDLGEWQQGSIPALSIGHVQLQLDVGKDLLFHAMRCAMVSLAGAVAQRCAAVVCCCAYCGVAPLARMLWCGTAWPWCAAAPTGVWRCVAAKGVQMMMCF